MNKQAPPKPGKFQPSSRNLSGTAARSGLPLQSHLRTGDISAANLCYYLRDATTVYCEARGWPQVNWDDICWGNNSTRVLKECLSKSGEKNWYKAFSSCKSDQQCLADSNGGACLAKCANEYLVRAKAKWPNEYNTIEYGRCMRTCLD